MAGIGGAFGAREDLSMQAHACMLALRTGRPVKISYSRPESFVGHVHRHPGTAAATSTAPTATGTLVYVKARILLDGGAYASSSTAVIANASLLRGRPVPSARTRRSTASVVYTNNPPCGAMRGFGSVQNCYAHEAQMDKLAAALGMDPVELRMRNAMKTGSTMITGQVIDGPVPVAELLRRVRDVPCPPAAATVARRSDRRCPAASPTRPTAKACKRGVGYAVGFKNIGYSEGFDDYSTARVRLSVVDGRPRVEVHTAARRGGPGPGHGAGPDRGHRAGRERRRRAQRRHACRLGRLVVRVAPDLHHRRRGEGRVRGGARAGPRAGAQSELRAPAERSCASRTTPSSPATARWSSRWPRCSATRSIEETREFHPRRHHRLDPETGQADAHLQYAFAAHRAVVDVDTELGLVKVVELATAQDVGKAINPQAVEGQLEGGAAQGLGLAVMEEIQVKDGVIRNASFTDYLLPTILDMPPVRMDILELGDPHSPYGLKGVGEPPTISSGPAIVAAIRAATGRPITRVPVRPHDIVDAVDDLLLKAGLLVTGSGRRSRTAGCSRATA